MLSFSSQVFEVLSDHGREYAWTPRHAPFDNEVVDRADFVASQRQPDGFAIAPSPFDIGHDLELTYIRATGLTVQNFLPCFIACIRATPALFIKREESESGVLVTGVFSPARAHVGHYTAAFLRGDMLPSRFAAESAVADLCQPFATSGAFFLGDVIAAFHWVCVFSLFALCFALKE